MQTFIFWQLLLSECGKRCGSEFQGICWDIQQHIHTYVGVAMLCGRHRGDSSSVGVVNLAIIHGGCAVGIAWVAATHLLCSASN